jgi:hypothetical protein
MIAPRRARRKSRERQDDTPMTKPPKRSFFAFIFPTTGLSLTKTLKSFTMKPDFGPGRAAVAWEN